MLIAALFTKNAGAPATGLTLAEINLYLYSRAKATGVVVTELSGVHPTEEIGGGIYTRAYVDDPATYDYFAYAHYTGVTVLDSAYSLQGSPAFNCAWRWRACSTRPRTSWGSPRTRCARRTRSRPATRPPAWSR